MSDGTSLVEKLGFYFVVFQPSLKPGQLRCWIDGNESYELYTEDDLLRFCNMNGIDQDVERDLKIAFSQTSFWLWDVENRKIKRLSSSYEIPQRNFFKEAIASKENTKVFESDYLNLYKDGVLEINL